MIQLFGTTLYQVCRSYLIYSRVSDVTPGFINISFMLSSLLISLSSSRFKAVGFRTRSEKNDAKKVVSIEMKIKL